LFIWRRYLDLKIKYKLLLSFLITVLLTICMLSLANYYVSAYAIKQNTLQQSKYLLKQISLNLENRANGVEENLFSLYKEEKLYTYLRGNRSPESIPFSNAVLDFINYSEAYVQTVTIIDRQGKPYSVNRKGQTKADPEALKTIQEADDLRALWGAAKWTAQGDKNTVYMMRALYDLDTTEYVGDMIVGIDARYLIDVYAGGGAAFLGSIVALNAEKEVMLYKEEADAERAGRLLSSSAERKQSGDRLSSVERSSDGEWIVVNMIPVEEITRKLASLRYWSVLAFAASISFAALLSLLISNHISASVKLLLSSVRSVIKGQFAVRIPPKGKDEIGLLAEEFNRMSENMKLLLERIREEQSLKQRTEYRMLEFQYHALQAQMNPHFLYNTLESINSLAKISGNKKISRLVILLGGLLRESIKKKGKFVTLAEEMSYVTKYLSIFKVIYEDRFEVRYELDERLEQARIPNFILQPIVENSVVHGIERKTGQGLLVVRGGVKDGLLYLEIEDNGVGMTEETMEAVLSGVAEKDADPKHTRVGIRSVRERLKLVYAERHDFRIRSTPGVGTSIRIVLPLDPKPPEEGEEHA